MELVPTNGTTGVNGNTPALLSEPTLPSSPLAMTRLSTGTTTTGRLTMAVEG